MDNETTKNLVAAVRERDRRIEELAQALVDQAAALDAALASERAATRARVEALPTVRGTIEAVGHREWRPHLIDVDRVDVDDVLAAIGGA